MNINFYSFSQYSLMLIKENFQLMFATQQRRILVIASIAFSCIAALYLISRYCFKETLIRKERSDSFSIETLRLIKRYCSKENLFLQKEKSFDACSMDVGKRYSPKANDHTFFHDKQLLNETDIKEMGNRFKDCQSHEYSKKIFHDGYMQEGEFHEGELNGQGKVFNSEGCVIMEGTFRKNLLIHGKCVFSDCIDEGDFKDGKLCGKGKRSYPDGSFLIPLDEGAFFEGELNGKGKKVNAKGDILIEGTFEKGKLIDGKKTFFFLDQTIVEEGQFFSNQLRYGNRCCSDGMIEEGEFTPIGLLHYGRKVYSDGMIEEGYFENNHLHGYGKRIFPDKVIEEGIFKNNKLHGKGKKLVSRNELKKNKLRYIQLIEREQDSVDEFIYPILE